MGGVSETIDRSARVSTLELFFDLVFVFTITQLTGVLVAGGDAASALQVVVMLAVIWWMYDGYAWLTNAIATDLLRFRLLLLGGMGAFLVIALAIPSAYEATGLAFGLGYAVVVAPPRRDVREGDVGLRGRPRSCASSRSTSRPRRWCSSAGALGGRPQDVLWAGAALLLWFTPWFTSTEGFVIAAEHFCERHGLVIIVALGESIVVDRRGCRRASRSISGSRVVALLSLALSAALWWLYFRDEDARRARDGGGVRVAARRGSRSSASATGTSGCCSVWSRSPRG